jgi:hypothetical protein
MFVMTPSLNQYSDRLPRQVICGPILYTSGYIRTLTPAIRNEAFLFPIWEIRSLNVRREAKYVTEQMALF